MALDGELWARARAHLARRGALRAAGRAGTCASAGTRANGGPARAELSEELLKRERRRERRERVTEVRDGLRVRGGVREVVGAHRRGGVFEYAEDFVYCALGGKEESVRERD